MKKILLISLIITAFLLAGCTANNQPRTEKLPDKPAYLGSNGQEICKHYLYSALYNIENPQNPQTYCIDKQFTLNYTSGNTDLQVECDNGLTGNNHRHASLTLTMQQGIKSLEVFPNEACTFSTVNNGISNPYVTFMT
jgi:hypothetical protein